MADKTLWFLASPHMKGSGIRDLQKELKRKGYLQGSVDGEFGPDTHRAVFRAKYHLGYLRPDHKAGFKLLQFLNGTRKLTPQMKLTQKARKPKPKTKTRGYRKLKLALSYLGVKENPPNSNRVLFSYWYGLIGAWCAMFCSYVGSKVGFKVYIKGKQWAYVPFMVMAARTGFIKYTITYKPISGDDVAFDWNPPGVADHVGVYAEEDDLKRLAPFALAAAKKRFGELGPGDFWCVEGNTSVTNNSNGGETQLRKRNKSAVQAFMHPGG